MNSLHFIEIHKYLSSLPRSKQIQEALAKLETMICTDVMGFITLRTDFNSPSKENDQ